MEEGSGIIEQEGTNREGRKIQKLSRINAQENTDKCDDFDLSPLGSDR
jgi:hypothetical protein